MIRPRIRLGLLACLTSLLFAITANAASTPSIEVEVHPQTLAPGETVALRIRVRGPGRSQEVDLAPLERDFDVVAVGRSERLAVINGTHDESVDWTVTLRPKHEGNIEIPPLSLGRMRTAAQSIQVAPPTAMLPEETTLLTHSAPAEPIIVQMEADRTNPYEQERVLVRVRLLVDAPVLEGTLSSPHIEGASVEQLGEDRSFDEELAGRHYRGIERTYVVVPNEPGTVEIPPVIFEAQIRDARPLASRRPFGRGLFDDLLGDSAFGDDLLDRVLGTRSRRVVVQSPHRSLEVRPRPAAAEDQWWFPARNVSLKEQWGQDPATATVGEALTRRIRIEVEGADKNAIPPIHTPTPDGAKQYTEAPRTNESAEGTVRMQDTTLIPTASGTLQLPAVEVHWWDVEAEAPRVAKLPERTIEVVGSALPAATSSAAATPDGVGPSPAAPTQDLRQRPVSSKLTFGILSTLMAVGAAAWILRRGPASTLAAQFRTRQALKRACRRKDPQGIAAALRVLRGLDGVSTDWGALEGEFADFDAMRYSGRDQEWNGEALWKAYRAARRRTPSKIAAARPGLPPLYPLPERPGPALRN